jgi:pSer/pThr/pTyr-binding forkhead associated (FHA) protein
MSLYLQVCRNPGTHVFDYRFEQDEVWIGRASSVDLRLPDSSISLVHLSLRRKGADYYVLDTGSTNGVRLNGEPLEVGRPVLLEMGARLEVGPFVLTVGGAGATHNTTADDTAGFARQMAREALGLAEPDHLPQIIVERGPQKGTSWSIATHATGVLGRGEDCEFCLTDADVSRRHLEIESVGAVVYLRDLGSHHGVELNDEPLRGQQRLATGDYIQLGQTRLRFIDPTEQYLRDLEDKDDQAARSLSAVCESSQKEALRPQQERGMAPNISEPEEPTPTTSLPSPLGRDAFLLVVGLLIVLTGVAAVFYLVI